MTSEQIARVQDSLGAVLPIKRQVAALFYDRLFAIDPSTRPLFAHADMAAQGDKLMAALGFVAGSLRTPGPMLVVVRQLAARHLAYGVRDAHYASVGEALLWTLETGLGNAWTADHRAAWAEAYTLLSGVMIEAARRSHTEHVNPTNPPACSGPADLAFPAPANDRAPTRPAIP